MRTRREADRVLLVDVILGRRGNPGIRVLGENLIYHLETITIHNTYLCESEGMSVGPEPRVGEGLGEG